MREIKAQLTNDLERHVADLGPAKAEPYPLETYRDLVEQTARLAYLNKDYLLFYRGQGHDFKNKAGASSFYPTIYRSDPLPGNEIALRFRRLERAASQLRKIFVKGRIEGHSDLARKRYVQWSVLQHYEVTATPLLDFTHSLRVACSFALTAADEGRSLVFVFGLPYLTNRISIHSEQDTVVVRLLSICPPSALRPYFQDGYLGGTTDVTADYDDKSELDFSNRLIAKFSIPTSETFWGAGLRGLSKDELYPPDDSMKTLCEQIRVDDTVLGQGWENDLSTLGEFVAAWSGLEQALLSLAQRREERVMSVAQAIRTLERAELVNAGIAERLDQMRRLRNAWVHGQDLASSQQLQMALGEVADLRLAIERRVKTRPRGDKAT